MKVSSFSTPFRTIFSFLQTVNLSLSQIIQVGMSLLRSTYVIKSEKKVKSYRVVNCVLSMKQVATNSKYFHQPFNGGVSVTTHSLKNWPYGRKE